MNATVPEDGKWTVVCGGPSIETLDLEAMKLGRVVCVNRAFYRFPDLCDVWSAQEAESSEMVYSMPDPDAGRQANTEATLALVERHRPEVWCSRYGHLRWIQLLKGIDGMVDRIDAWDPTRRDTRLPRVGARFWKLGTTMMTLAKLYLLGARHVRLLGCDMAGIGGWRYEAQEGGPEYVEWESRLAKTYPDGWWSERWLKESRALRQIRDVYCEAGIALEHIRSVPIPKEQLS